MNLVPSEPLEKKLETLASELSALRVALEHTGDGNRPEWLPRRKLATMFGMSPRSADMYIAAAISSAALRTIKPRALGSATGHMLYNVRDFETFISRTA
jgi:hypothetical protein